MPDARSYLPRIGRHQVPAAGSGRGRWPTHSDSVVAWGWYVDGVKQDCTDLGVASDRAKVGEGFVWLGLKDPTDEDMSKFAKQFDLHELAIEDAIEGHTRSKLEVFDDDVFAVVSTIAYVDHESVTETSEVVATGQIMVFVCPNYALTVRRGDHAALSGLRARLETDPERLSLGPASVLYGVLDVVVDDYNRVVREFENDVDEIEEMVFSRQGTREIDRVYQLKRELIEFKRSVVPLASPLAALSTRSFPNIPEDARAYFREVADHHTEAREAIASYDEVLTSLLQAGLARASVEDNQDMRKISAAVAILAVPTTIGAIYGMNFTNMPELDTRYGYFVVLVMMAVAMLGTYAFFRRNHWL
ncbi:MAG TPA: magnesium/cobalt transporter CorA [Propionibacteriaceae bacterium]|nr:magnesium/cobalt transporter CorA [Propionibacteriaceae bacterium]